MLGSNNPGKAGTELTLPLTFKTCWDIRQKEMVPPPYGAKQANRWKLQKGRELYVPEGVPGVYFYWLG
jgi:hypothetical protein